jgi:cholesterol oxidase
VGSAAPDTHFDTIVVGSGFGGSVMAHRLAEAGRRVCVLERGKAYPPGSFPRSPYQMASNFWDPTQGLFGLFDYWSFAGLNALVSSGLGGGSLIYANVLLRKDERWFVKEDVHAGGFEYWPVTRADLDPHYDRVERMLTPTPYPLEHPPYDRTPKTRAFAEAAERNGREWFLPPLAITFGNPGHAPAPGVRIDEEHSNIHGQPRYTCRLIGECDVGCNFGSKNSLDYTYLSAAQRAGADIRPRCEVRMIEPRPGGGYRVGYIHHAPEHDGEPIDLFDPASVRHELTADRLVLSAGSLGTTRLILRNRSAFPRLSHRLGTRFCGNGDLLTFAMKPSEEAGGARVPRVIDPTFGPVITAAVRVADELDGGDGRGFYLEDAGFPDAIAWMVQLLELPRDLWRWRGTAGRLVRERLKRDRYRHTGRSAALAELFGGSELAAGVLPMLGMGRDVPDGRMYLRHNHLRVDWRKGRSGRPARPGRGRSAPYFDRVRALSRDFSDSLGARFRDDPIWFLSRVITVHPLGGCPMGRDRDEGVVDAFGEAFGYPGLFIADGSTMPGPVGPNPSLTIAALADRSADRMLEPAAGPR